MNWGCMADQLDLRKKDYGNGIIYFLPPSWENGWIVEMAPSVGLFTSSAWFTPEREISYRIHREKPFLWIFCVDCGDIILTQRGKPSKHLTPVNHIFVNPQKPFRITFPKGVHTCFTSVLVSEDFIQNFLNGRNPSPPIGIKDAMEWKELHCNTPDIMLILEQIRWGIRNGDMPFITYECKVIELLTMIMRNAQSSFRLDLKRRNHVTWNDEQKIYLVKQLLDKDILHPPTIETMCRISEMSESKMRSSFKNVYGSTLYDYIRTETMKRAMQLLADDELSIKNIATKCGYKNPAKFAAAFKDIHGIAPSQFRKAFNL